MTPKNITSLLKKGTESFQPGLSVDCVIFGFHEGKLKILLNRFLSFDKWMIPGGFAAKNENVNDSAHRVLSFRTGLKNIYLKQFYFFGDIKRTSMTENDYLLQCMGYSDPEERKNHWLMQRFVSIGYYALVEFSKVKIQCTKEEEIKWFDYDEIPELYSDHNQIIEKAISNIRKQLVYTPIGYELLPEKFTLTELRLIYESILGKSLDRRNFQRKILSLGYILKLDETQRKIGMKPTTIYSFDKKKYKQAMEEGMMEHFLI